MIKKLVLVVSVFSLLAISNYTHAATIVDKGCNGGAYSTTTGQKCVASGAVLGASLTVTPDPTPRIMYWSGKVNQHIDVNGVWQSDPDGTSGANIDKVTYCKKWYPNTTSVTPYQMETIDTWRRAAGYEQSGYTATIMSDQCVQSIVNPTSSITVLAPNGGEVYQAGQQITITWNTANVSGNITEIDLIDSIGWGGGTGLTFDKEIPNTGSYTVTLPTASDFTQANAPYGKYFSIKIYAANGAIQDSSDNLFTIQASVTTNDTTPRIMYWYGKVNQHIDTSGAWQTDPDGTSGANIDKVTYCKKWYPTTTTTTPYQMETISTWHDQGNIHNYTATIMSDKCVTSTQQAPSITVVSPNGGEIFAQGQSNTITWINGNGVTQIGLVSADSTTNSPNILGWINTAISPGSTSISWDGRTTTDLTGTVTWTVTPGMYKILAVGSSLDGLGNYCMGTSGIYQGCNFDLSNAIFKIQAITTYPAGCTSALGYSPTTGVPCSNPVVNFVPGCTSMAGYSSTTGQSCAWWTQTNVNVTYGCSGTTGFSVTTGQPCANTNTYCLANSPQKVTVLAPNGGESYLPVEMPVTWKTCKISASTLMRIDLVMYKPNGTVLTRFIKNTVNDGIEAISLPTITTWPQMVYGNNFKIKIRRANFTSPQDLSDNKFTIAPAKATVLLDPTTPSAGTVMVNNTSGTNNITVLKFQVKAENSDLTLRKIPIQIVSSSGNVSSKINSIKLIKGPSVVDSMDGSYGSAITTTGAITTGPCTTTCGFIFNNLSSPYNKVATGTTENFTIAVDLKALSGNYAEGESLTVSIANPDVITTSNFSVQDLNGDQLPSSQRFGSAIGNTQTLRTSGINVVMNSPSYTHMTDVSGNTTEVTYTIPLTVTAYGSTYYVGQTAQQAVSATSTNAFAYGYNIAQAPAIVIANNGDSSILTSLDANIEGSGYRLDDGATKHFTLTVVLTTPTTPNSMYRVALQQIRVFTNSLLTTGTMNINLLPINSYQTGYQLINN